MVRTLNVYTISIFVALGGSLFGFEIGSMSIIIGTPQYQKFFNNPLGVRQGIIISATTCGSFVGALSSSILADRFSRKLTIQLGALLWCIGSCLQSASSGVLMLVIGRAVAGLCIGLTSTVVPIYQSEIAPRKIRGRVVQIQNWALGWGLVIQYFIQYGCSHIDSTAAFRVPWAIQTIPAIILFVSLFKLPHSPRWLAYRDRWSEALLVLAFLRTANCDPNDPLVIAEYKEIEAQIFSERESSANSYRELLGRRLRKRLFIGMAIQAFTQLGGINFLMYFIVDIQGSVSNKYALLTSSLLNVFGTLSGIPVLIWTDKWGRRLSLLVGAVSLAFWMYFAGGLFATFGEKNPVENQAYTWIIVDRPVVSGFVLAAMYLFVISYSMSWGPVSWIYPPEIMPQLARAKGVSMATATNWLFNSVLGLSVPPLWRAISWRIFFMFGSVHVVAFVFVWLLVPETKQRTLEEMDEVFEHGEPLWRSFTSVGNRDRLDILAAEIANSSNAKSR
ncbi:general substrate transporter [Lipomyces tetrasporus]